MGLPPQRLECALFREFMLTCAHEQDVEIQIIHDGILLAGPVALKLQPDIIEDIMSHQFFCFSIPHLLLES